MSSERAELLKALHLEKQGDWDLAHRMVQLINSRDGARIHAYLHRREGDRANATYWYHRGDCDVPTISLDEEWQQLANYYSTEG